ncbi:MAG: hypothetical protein ACR2IB_06800 [Pyrinomonadaceae bacterium]
MHECAADEQVVIEQLGITQAFADDHHFKQFSTVQIVPERGGPGPKRMACNNEGRG